MGSSLTTKLTLSIPVNLVKAAKSYSNKAKRPLSQLISQYFTVLTMKLDVNDIPEKVAKVTGLAKSSDSDADLLWTAVAEKYLK